ncbi:MAG TPA: hypothetical protein VFG74_10410 [Miltoncostaeaceae bacterium]|jgi:hypothetical protein|nr:hypothetical protein [Miltoncostaeaceae bacterium]
MGSPDIKLIPTDFDIDMGVDANVTTVSDVTADVTATTSSVVMGSRDAPIALRVEPLDVSATLKGDPQAPITANAGVALDVRNLPHLTFEQINELLRTVTLARSRIRFPVSMNVGFSVFPLTLLGIDALSFTVCGEPAVIRDDCVPDCEEPCVEVDDRPKVPKG